MSDYKQTAKSETTEASSLKNHYSAAVSTAVSFRNLYWIFKRKFPPLFPQNPFRNHFPHFAFCNSSPLSSHLLLSSHTHAVHTPKQTQCRIKQPDLTFLLGLLKQEQLPPIPSPPSHFLPPLFPPSLGFPGKQHVLASKSRAPEDQLLILHSSTIRAEEMQESHNILHVHHDQDRAVLTFKRKTPLLSTDPMPTMASTSVCRLGLWQSRHLKGPSDKGFQLLSFYPYTWSPLQR